MSAKEVKLYPIERRWKHDAPHAVHVVATKGEADDLIASGAFTDNPQHAERDHSAPDLTKSSEPTEIVDVAESEPA